MSSASDPESIRNVLARYMVAVDDMIGGDPEALDAVVSCFAPHAITHYPGIDAQGEREIRDMFSGRSPRDDPALDGFSRLPVSTHAMLTTHLDIDGDAADSCTSATANLCGTRDGRQVIMIRGLRYLDRLERATDGWWITRRHLVVDWAYEVPAAHIASPRFTFPRG